MGLNFYFRQWQIHNAAVCDVKGPVIFVPTHQNAFLDAILVICSQRRNPWSIARASVFKKGLVERLLTAVRIKPVFRMRDGFSTLKNNEAIFEEWTNMLAQGEDITIFAEGNHNEPYARGKLQKGFARMALKFQQQHQHTPLTIIPVAIYYEEHYAFRSRVLVNFGAPIDVNSIDHANLNEREKLERIVEITEDTLYSLTVTIGTENHADQYAFLKTHRQHHRDLRKQVQSDREILNLYPAAPPVKRRDSPTPYRKLNPLVWFGWLLNLPPYLMIRNFIRTRIKDPQWIGSLKYAFGIFLVPVYYLVLTGICFAITRSLPATLLAAFVLPVSAVAAADALRR